MENSVRPSKKGAFMDGEDGGTVVCRLCPHNCRIKNGSFGKCGARGNKGGEGIIPFYGMASCLAVDPIEKKPLYHFKPGSEILSAGFVGCNMGCPFCQNWRISQNTAAPLNFISAGEIALKALRQGVPSIAYTYSEPLVHAEYILDCMAQAKRCGIKNVLVTNGCANDPAAKEILSMTDAANIDLKCFSRETYADILEGDLEATLSFIELACRMGVHVEVTTLVVSGLNDSCEELGKITDFLADINGKMPGNVIPWHLSAYSPNWKWSSPATAAGFLLAAAKEARKKLPFVYTGNIAKAQNNTACAFCGEILVRREGYKVEATALSPPRDGGRHFLCAACGGETGIAL